MSLDINSPLRVSALIVTRKESGQPLEILNVLAHNKTKYGFPGGKLEESESPEDAVIRETEEELGVTPTNLVYQATYEALTPEGRGISMFVFTGSVTEDIAPTNEIAELHWLTYDQMTSNLELLTPMTIEHVLPLIKSL
jgi:8-oxo-dGTP pyrophosphatase MutT (NUDIX family)